MAFYCNFILCGPYMRKILQHNGKRQPNWMFLQHSAVSCSFCSLVGEQITSFVHPNTKTSCSEETRFIFAPFSYLFLKCFPAKLFFGCGFLSFLHFNFFFVAAKTTKIYFIFQLIYLNLG